jgi:predicted DCC family thiol-disulfide oxidoreductase YuxK
MMNVTPIMLYDGDCALCTGTVQFVLDHEKAPTLHFAPLQSELGRSYLKELGLAVDDFDSYVIVEEGRGSRKIKAAQRMGYHMGGIWRALSYASLIVPTFVGDAIYSYIFRNRIRWFGRPASCRKPDPAAAHRFLGEGQTISWTAVAS